MKMVGCTSYSILSTEEKILLENLISKLAVAGVKQYNTQVATILFNGFITYDKEEITPTNNLISPDTIQEIKDDLKFIDEYIMEMQDMMRRKPIITNLEKLRKYIDRINTKVNNL